MKKKIIVTIVSGTIFFMGFHLFMDAVKAEINRADKLCIVPEPPDPRPEPDPPPKFC